MPVSFAMPQNALSKFSLFTAAFLAGVLSLSCAQASTSGLDTPTGIDTLPLAIQGTPYITLNGTSTPGGANITTSEPLRLLGYVAINQSTPAVYPLDVNGQVRASQFRAAQAAPNAVDSSTNGYAFGADGDTGMFSPIRYDGPANNGYDNGEVALFVNSYDALHVKWTGNIGIGTTEPQAKLDVAGNVNATSYQRNNTALITMYGSTECLTPEGGPGNGSSWAARSMQGAATGCNSNGVATCSVGTPVTIGMGHDQLAEGEFGNFCKYFDGTLFQNGCHTSLYFCE